MPGVFWVTGLSGAGKTTFSHALAGLLRDAGYPVVLLDGDELRAIFDTDAASPTGHDRDNRVQLAMRYSRLCQSLAFQGVIVVIATISMFSQVQQWNRENIQGYFEIYLRTPIAELRRRDPKGIYRKYDEGALKQIAGLDLPVDEPASPDWLVPYEAGKSAAQTALELFKHLKRKEAA